MLLSQMLDGILSLPANAEREITQLVLDSRHIQPGDAFVAIKGAHTDGRTYIHQALSKGATAILLEAEEGSSPICFEQAVPIIPINKLAQQLGVIASKFYGFPAKQMAIYGVTGTNGKTSCTHYIAQSLNMLSQSCGIIGTLGSGFLGNLNYSGLTTPDAIHLQKLLRDLYLQGAQAVAMEVSSHSIHQSRISGIDFDIAVFTNLTQDHLDYHRTMAAYASVKYSFLASLAAQKVILNIDDPYGKQWLPYLMAQKETYAYSIEKPNTPSAVPLIYTEQVSLSLDGIYAELYSPWGNSPIYLPLIGQFNLSNALAAFTTLCVIGIPFTKAINCFRALKPVAGRMQTFGGKDKPLLVVDYAHTPDALEKVLQSLRLHTPGQLICVFGCGGERDPSKRKQMARIAETWADKIFVTNDNPRHEDPKAIAQEILKGFAYPDQVQVTLDRSQAIENSIQWASTGDCVLIAGKGAEQYQQIGEEKIPFDDASKVANCLARYNAEVQS